MPFIQPSGYSNKRTKAFYETNDSKRSKSSLNSKKSLSVIDSVPCAAKGRPKKPKENKDSGKSASKQGATK